MMKKVDDIKKELLINEKENKSKVKKQKNRMSLEESNSVKRKNSEVFLKKKLTKSSLVTFFLMLIDILLIIYFARKNVVHYVEVLDEKVFVSETKYLIFGRNYITLIVTIFFYVYTLALQKFFFKRKFTIKYVLFLGLFYLVINILLFYLFTNRVY